ncbi:amino acid ABC transporter substrate-binding protein (plasmid) [Pseudoalteromonas sp. T1lg65]|uniref:amino acid ABC transporter substrate-binding protein n=1 Tax=Pseudoalteromonas sp. T1lg65 TaxID=2077101 RepID=UPI003F7B13D7
MNRFAAVVACSLLYSNCSYAFTLNIVTENFPDFQHQNAENKLVGKAADKVRAVLERSEIDYAINVLNWSVAYNAALRREDTCIFSIARNEIRENELTWVFPISTFTTSFYALRENSITLETIDDAKQYRTAVIRDNFSHQYLLHKGFVEGKQLILINSFDKVFQLLKTRKDFVDLVILSDAQYRFRAESEPTARALEPVYTLNKLGATLYFACNKQVPEHIINRLSRSYKQLYGNHESGHLKP